MEFDVSDWKPQYVQRISELVYQAAGINLKQNKEALVRARLMKRLRALGIRRVSDYLDVIASEAGGEEVGRLVDVMTTNKTSFFRENEHFSFLRDSVLPQMAAARLRFWSAACSSGEEPYTLAIVLREHLAGIDHKDVRILATDISRRMLEKARQAIYPSAVLQEAPLPQYRRYFLPLPNGHRGAVRIGDFLPQRDDLLRPSHPAAADPAVLGGPGGRRVSLCRALGRPVGDHAPLPLCPPGGLPEIGPPQWRRGVDEYHRVGR